MKINNRLLLMLVTALLVTGCATSEPNSNERTADMAWLSGRYADAAAIVIPYADKGEAWAQLRLGIIYENGWATKKDIDTAIFWYKKAAAQKSADYWGAIRSIGADNSVGKNKASSDENRNNQARVAQYNLANIYLQRQQVIYAYLNIRTIVDETQGQPILFCCEFSEARYFTADQIAALYQGVKSQMSAAQIKAAEAKYASGVDPLGVPGKDDD